jgi:hypothetical protein
MALDNEYAPSGNGRATPFRFNCINADTSSSGPDFSLTPGSYPLDLSEAGIGHTDEPWSSYSAVAEASGPSANPPSEFINPSLLLPHTTIQEGPWLCEAPGSPFIGLPNTGLSNQDERRTKEPIDDAEFPDPKAKKKRTKIPREALAILKRQWDLDVYPQPDECTALAAQTKLEYKTVWHWFANRRRRTEGIGQ